MYDGGLATDLFGDGIVNVSDLGILATNHGLSVAVAMPEPGVQVFLLGAMISVIFHMRRIRQS